MADFVGRWRLERQIDDHTTGHALHFSGEAVLTPDGSDLSYAETGQLMLPGQSAVHATRTYTWRASPGGVRVFFSDGGYFHAFDPDATCSSDRHWCDPDTYVATYSFLQWPVWQADWRVQGPRKDYLSRSTYSRF
ncbi:MAG: DUF6314 family protein [Rhodobacteraceae bacterium]|nr:DUF6314 family protein [Paracoccaceae bacterium]